jgi:hypothetical protein
LLALFLLSRPSDVDCGEVETTLQRCDKVLEKVNADLRPRVELVASAGSKMLKVQSIQKSELFSEDGVENLKAKLKTG